MHEAEQYLRNPATPNSLYVQYGGSRRRLFYNPSCGFMGIIKKGCKRRGIVFRDWDGITRVFYPKPAEDEAQAAIDRERKITAKYIRQARKATHTNPFIRKCLAADPEKSPYKNHLTTGNRIDGQLI